MAKHWHSFVVVIIIAILTSINSIVAEDKMHSSLGVSDMNIVGFVNEMETKRFEVGRVYNTGDFNMTITSSWLPEGNSEGVQVTIVPQQMFLEPLAAKTVCAEVLGLIVGNYTGKVAFSCDIHLPPTYIGNPSVPSGQANAKFIVQAKESPKPKETSIPTSLWNPTVGLVVVAIMVVMIITVIATVFVFGRNRGTREIRVA